MKNCSQVNITLNFIIFNKQKKILMFKSTCFWSLFLLGSSVWSLLCFSGCTGTESRKHQNPENTDWISLFDGKSLEGWEITNFGTQGPVQVSQGSIVIGMGDGCSGINLKDTFPFMNYEVKLQAKKVTGNDFFCGMTFPVGETFCSLIIGGWGGPVVGLSSIDGNDAAHNETQVLKKFEHGQWYSILLKVTDTKIEAWIDNEQLIDFETEGRQLSIRPEVSLSKPFGICTWMTTAEIKDIYLKLL
jgi:hypothetical protein